MIRKIPKVSVIVVTYGQDKYIEQAINGIIIQKGNFEIELIISDDNSPDDTQKIIENFLDLEIPRIEIRYFRQIVNLGVIKNFIWCINECSGDYIAFCEGDDYWIDPYKIEKQLSFLESNADFGLVHTNYHEYYVINGSFKKNILSPTLYNSNQNEFESLLLGKYPIKTCTVLFKVELLDKSQLSECISFKMIDTFLWLSLARKTKFKYLDFVSSVYRVNLESASKSKDYNKILNFKISGFELYKYFIEKYEVNDRIKYISYANGYEGIFSVAFELQNRFLLISSFLNIVKYSNTIFLSWIIYTKLIFGLIPFGTAIYYNLLKLWKPWSQN